MVTSRRGFMEGTIPCRANPLDATCLKMAGRRGEEETAERLGKPASGTVVGRVGPADEPPGTTREPDPGNRAGRGLSSLQASYGQGNLKRGVCGREAVDGGIGQHRVGESNPKRGSPKESRPWARVEEGIPEGSSAANAKTEPGAGNPTSLLLRRLAIL